MSSDKEKSPSSRLSRRSFGVSNRVWLIILFILAVFGITHHLSPSSQARDFRPYSTVDLKSINYLNGTEKPPNPFEFCPSYGPGDKLGTKYGPSVLSQSRVHLGSGARIHRVLNRALNGHPVTISVLGSSVTSCHGAGDDPLSPKCYPSKFFRWWNSVFPHPATELTNGAMRRTNSGYFGFCNAHHLPDVTDLVIIELDTEDSPDKDMIENFEILIRSILIRPDQPAVLLLGHFSPQIHSQYGFAGPDHHHNAVAQFYDVPHVSIKSALYSDYIRDPNSVSKYYVDPVLSSPLGHDLITDILVAYLQDQICTVWGVATGQIYSADSEAVGIVAGNGGIFGGVGQRKGVPEEHKDPGDGLDANGNRIKPEGKDSAANINALLQAQLRVPAGRINTRPNSGHAFEEIAPYCVSANDLINPLPPSLFYGSGWHAFHPSTGSGSGSENALKTTAHYWYSTLPTSRLRIPIQVGAGDIGVYYLKEPVSAIGEGSAVECWVDDNYAGAKVIENAADISESVAALEVIDHYVSRGSHFVECQLMGEEGQGVPAFKIVGIFST